MSLLDATVTSGMMVQRSAKLKRRQSDIQGILEFAQKNQKAKPKAPVVTFDLNALGGAGIRQTVSATYYLLLTTNYLLLTTYYLLLKANRLGNPDAQTSEHRFVLSYGD